MRFSAAAVVVTLSSLAAAQDILGSLPKCGQDCFGNNFQNCGQFDYKCICGNTQLIAELSCCVSTSCDSADQNTIITLASGLCKAYGVDTPTKASCASGASSTTAAASSGSSNPSGSASGSTGSVTSAPATTTASETVAAASGASSGSPGAAGPVATAGSGLGLAIGMAGLLAAL